MATIAKWRKGNTRPGIRVTLDMGLDPATGSPRSLDSTDTVSVVMRNDTTAGIAQIRAATVVTTAPPVVDWKPEDGDFDEAGEYDVVFDVTDVDGDVETIPNDSVDDYSFHITDKPGD